MVYQFQFPNGSIKSYKGDCMDLIPKRFNSLMVRLKAFNEVTAPVATIGFNSLMVRLKVAPAQLNARAKQCFNSLMVRLKDRCVTGGVSVAGWFQFPNGSIKRGPPAVTAGKFRKVSIP